MKTAMQMRDQGHALKQKALDLVAEAEKKVHTSTINTNRAAEAAHCLLPSNRYDSSAGCLVEPMRLVYF